MQIVIFYQRCILSGGTSGGISGTSGINVIFYQRCILSGGTGGGISGTSGINVIFYPRGILSRVYFFRIPVDR